MNTKYTIILLFLLFLAPATILRSQDKQVISGLKGCLYTNPVLPGSFCDPSLVRVGKKFYMVNTTFQFFPGISICESEDLVHWKHIANVLTRQSDVNLNKYPDNLGIWAPDISYHDGIFYVFYCEVFVTGDRKINVRGNYLVTAKNILGPWSIPIQLTTEGNDPSHFIDDDGTHYMLYAAGLPRGNKTKIVKLNNECTKVVEGPFWMAWGDEKAHPEGPHMYKLNGYYYHTMTCGEVSTGICKQIIARSKNIYGPYEESPGNPVIIQSNKPGHLVQTEHAKFVQTENGDWWALFHSQRMIDGANILGRETSLGKLTWNGDGWPILNDGKGVLEEGIGPDLPVKTYSVNNNDDFNEKKLRIDWQFVRNPDDANYSLTERKGFLRIYPTSYPLDSTKAKNIIVRRQVDFKFDAVTSLEFNSKVGEAGIVSYYHTNSYISFGLSNENGSLLRITAKNKTNKSIVVEHKLSQTPQKIFLKVATDYLNREFYYSIDNKNWILVGKVENATYLSGLSGYYGSMIGMYAINPGNGNSKPADFDFFNYKSK